MKKINRLLKNDDFKRVIDGKRFFSNKCFSMYYLPNDLGRLRIGISVGHKFGGAVQRNKAKRQVRMMISQTMNIVDSLDIVLMIRKGYGEIDYDSNSRELKYLFDKMKKRGEKANEII